MELRMDDVVLVRGRVVRAIKDGPATINFVGTIGFQVVEPEAIAGIETPVIYNGDKVAWTGRDEIEYLGEVLGITLEPTGAAWAWVKCPAVKGGFATLKTTELRRA